SRAPPPPNPTLLPATAGDTGHGDPSDPHRPAAVAPVAGTEIHGRLGRSGSEWRDRPDRRGESPEGRESTPCARSWAGRRGALRSSSLPRGWWAAQRSSPCPLPRARRRNDRHTPDTATELLPRSARR